MLNKKFQHFLFKSSYYVYQKCSIVKFQCLFPVMSNKDFTLQRVCESHDSFDSSFFLCLKSSFVQFSYSQYQRLMIFFPFLFLTFWIFSSLSDTSHCPEKYISVFLIRTLLKNISSEKFNKVPLLLIGSGVYALLQGMKPVPATNWPKRCLSSALAMSGLLTANYYSVP